MRTKADLQFTNTPNLLTLVRILAVPVVVGILYLRIPRWDLIAALLFGAAAITDYVDGYLARARKIVTLYGKLMDPLADKILVVSSIIMLQELGRVPAVTVMILICRELMITGLRGLAAAEGIVISASNSAKWKTGTQMVALPFIMAQSELFGLPLGPIGQVLLYISLAISLWSGAEYFVSFFKAIQEE